MPSQFICNKLFMFGLPKIWRYAEKNAKIQGKMRNRFLFMASVQRCGNQKKKVKPVAMKNFIFSKKGPGHLHRHYQRLIQGTRNMVNHHRSGFELSIRLLSPIRNRTGIPALLRMGTV
jgi:hypothetical protein